MSMWQCKGCQQAIDVDEFVDHANECPAMIEHMKSAVSNYFHGIDERFIKDVKIIRPDGRIVIAIELNSYEVAR